MKKIKKPKKHKIDLWREWLVPDNAYHRYSGLRGIYWYWLSRDIRKDEWEKYGVCLTCQQPIEDWHYADCGHIINASKCGEYLRFARENLVIQHKHCNNPRITPDASLLNAVNYNKRYGAGAIEKLYELKKKVISPVKKSEWETRIRALKSYQEAQ